jgi:hypothetical protein
MYIKHIALRMQLVTSGSHHQEMYIFSVFCVASMLFVIFIKTEEFYLLGYNAI